MLQVVTAVHCGGKSSEAVPGKVSEVQLPKELGLPPLGRTHISKDLKEANTRRTFPAAGTSNAKNL